MDCLPTEVQTIIINYISYTTCRTVCLKWKLTIDKYKVERSFSHYPERASFDKKILTKYILNCTNNTIGYFSQTEDTYDSGDNFVMATMTWFVRSKRKKYEMKKLSRSSGCIPMPSRFTPFSVLLTAKSIVEYIDIFQNLHEKSSFDMNSESQFEGSTVNNTFYPSQDFIRYLYKHHPLATSDVYCKNMFICHKSYYIDRMKKYEIHFDKKQIDEYVSQWESQTG
jgi:hypothetical protein